MSPAGAYSCSTTRNTEEHNKRVEKALKFWREYYKKQKEREE